MRTEEGRGGKERGAEEEGRREERKRSGGGRGSRSGGREHTLDSTSTRQIKCSHDRQQKGQCKTFISRK